LSNLLSLQFAYREIQKSSARIDMKKAEEEALFDGKWVLVTDTNLSAEAAALKYKELWQVERVFRDMKSMLETRPVYHHTTPALPDMFFAAFWPLFCEKSWSSALPVPGITSNGLISSRISRRSGR
jgi:hypothetical protein